MKLFTQHRIPVIAVLVAVIALGATACGSGSSSSSSTPAAAGGGSTGDTGGGAQGTPVDVSLKDFSIDVTGGTTLAAGTYTFHVTNNGPASHNLTINGPGVSNQTTGTFAAGGTADLTVTLKDGSYEFYCSVPGHKQLGMDATVTVGTGGSGGGGSSNGGGSSGGGSSASGGGWS